MADLFEALKGVLGPWAAVIVVALFVLFEWLRGIWKAHRIEMDTRMKEFTERIKEKADKEGLDRVQQEVQRLEQRQQREIDGMRDDMNGMRSDMQDLRSDMSAGFTRLTELIVGLGSHLRGEK